MLVLGLERSGKSTLVSQIVKEIGQNSIIPSSVYKPTEGFNVTSLSDGASPTVNIWESKKHINLNKCFKITYYLMFQKNKNPILLYIL